MPASAMLALNPSWDSPNNHKRGPRASCLARVALAGKAQPWLCPPHGVM
jgi:hypothetical protein